MSGRKRFLANLTSLLIFILISTFNVPARPGRLDFSFPNSLQTGGEITAIENQTDGKILLAGRFITNDANQRKDIIRLNADGSLDSSFNAGSGLDNIGYVLKFIQLGDGKILICGSFNSVNGVFVRAVARLNSDGSVDQTFALSGIDITFAYDMDVQADGKILVSASNLIGSSFITRLGANGANDQGVGQPLFMASGGYGYRLAYMPTGNNIIVGGHFSLGATQNNIARLSAAGGVDSSFQANVISNGFDGSVTIRRLANEKLLIYGKFDAVNQVTRRNIAILNSDGSLDSSFAPQTAGSDTILSASVQSDGKIIIAGRGFAPNSLVGGNIARLRPDGTIDASFRPGRGFNNAVNALAISGNRLLVGGKFFRYDTTLRPGLAAIFLN